MDSSPVVVAAAAKSSKGEGDFLGLSKWAWAALAGGVVAAGITIYIISGGGDSESDKKKKKSSSGKKAKKTKATPNDTPTKSKVTVQDIDEEEDSEKEITDPLEKALAAKNKGNKYFRGGRYELAIKCYTHAIDVCPESKQMDLATFYQNRAAAFEQLENDSAVLSDCTMALKLNGRYVKAMERRARVLRKKSANASKNCGDNVALEEQKDIICQLKTALEDVTAVCILEGFQKQDHMMLVDTILKELGRAEAKYATATRVPIMCSNNFIRQYFQSFAEDPTMKSLEKETNGNLDENTLSGLDKAKQCLREEVYDKVIEACSQEIDNKDSEGDRKSEALLLRATFYILSKQQTKSYGDLRAVIDNESCNKRLRSNALIKRASLYIQQCKDPEKDPQMAMDDFVKAVEIDPENADVYHHRGQVNLLTENIEEASRDFDRAVELNPSFPVAYVQKLYTDYRLGLKRNDQEKINNVINLFEQAVEKFPKCVESYALYAQVLSDQNKFEKADQYYVDAAAVDPQNANLLVHRGLVQLQWKGDVVKAVELITKALDVDDKCEFAYETLGTVEVQRGNLSKAIALFEKALPLANTELEMGHLFGLRNAAIAQTTVSARLGITLPGMPS